MAIVYLLIAGFVFIMLGAGMLATGSRWAPSPMLIGSAFIIAAFSMIINAH